MKKLVFGLIAFIALTNTVNSQTTESRGSRATWPYGCRVWTIGINIGVFSATSEVTLCCVPTNWRVPSISCTEVTSKSSNSNSSVYQYVMIDEIEKNINKKIETDKIEVFNEKLIETEDGNYNLVKDIYSIELNDRKERFIKLKFEKIN